MLEITVLGPTTVRTTTITAAGTTSIALGVDGLGGTKPRQILEILALAAGSPVSKERLADLLWDGRPPRAYLATLESYVCVLRRSLGLGRGRDTALATVPHGYLLDPAQVRVDVAEFGRLVRQAASASAASALPLLREALDLVRGDLLPGEDYASWAVEARRGFQLELSSAASQAASLSLQHGDPATAVDLARRAVEADRLNEGAWRLLMLALSRSGRRPEALRAFTDLRGHLERELGSDPCAESADLFVEILRSEDVGSTMTDAREEVRMLMGLLRRAVAAVPGIRVPCDDDALARVAAELATTDGRELAVAS